MYKRMFFAAVAMIFGCVALECGAMTGFDADYDAAMARAKEGGKPLFLLFTGSDWCIWCKKLEKEVFSQPEFLDIATNAYELVVLDFPHDQSRQTNAERERNRSLSEKYEVDGFPTILLLDANGVEIYRAGYEPGGAKAWIESFQKGVRAKPLYDKFLKPFEDEMDAEVAAMLSVVRSAFAPEGETNDFAKIAAARKATAQAHLPKLESIRERLAATDVPAELGELKAEMLDLVVRACEDCESLDAKDVNALAAELAESFRQIEEMRRNALRESEEDAEKARLEREAREEAWLRDWTENVRTNMSLETCASFRETRLRPFLLAEMDPAGQTTEEERRILDAAIDHIWGTGGFKTFKDKDKLVEILGRTAKKPFATLVAAFARKQDKFAAELAAWLESGGFSGEDMRAVFWALRNNVNFKSDELLEAVGKAQVDEWLKLPWRIGVERRKAWNARGSGWAKDVTDEGWDGWKTHGDACREAFARAWELHPYPEAAYLFSDLGPFDDEVFLQATASQLDFRGFFESYLWYNCYPRWCGSHRKMKQFAERCRATGRHDTMVPYFYAEALLKMVKDMDVRLEDYFRDHDDELDNVIEVSLPQITSTNAFANVRKAAGVFATLAYYLKGDYAKAAETWRSFPHPNGNVPNVLWKTIGGLSDWWTTFDGISGKNAAEFQRLNALYLSGDFAEFLKGIEALREKGVEFDKNERVFAEENGLMARMKTDFLEGKEVAASFPKDFTTWRNFGGVWRMNGTFAFRDGKFNYGDNLEWIAPIPPDVRIECEIAPNGERDAWQFDIFVKPFYPVVSEWGDWPHLSLKFAGGKCDIAFGSWSDVYKNGSPEKATVDYAGGATRLAVEYKGGRASIFLGDGEAPLIVTDAFADQLRQTTEGHAKFNGCGVRLLSLKVVRPENE